MSGLHKAFVDGMWTDTIDFPFMIDGQVFDKLWVTVDGIYPQIGRFVKKLSQPVGQAEQDYASWQENRCARMLSEVLVCCRRNSDFWYTKLSCGQSRIS
jgi:hypothetical protein